MPPITKSLSQSPEGPEEENKEIMAETTKPYSEELASWLGVAVLVGWWI